MQEAFEGAKKELVSFLEEAVGSYKHEFKEVNRWVDESLTRLVVYAQRGKMLRGSLACIVSSALGVSRSQAVRVGVAIELLQSGVLVHDDIMDGDTTRRGAASLHAQLEEVGGPRFGLGGGICVGDVSLFLAFRILNSCERSQELVELFSREAVSLGFGQMQDVYFGVSEEEPSVESILSVYRYKTARYTFVLPLLLACCLADREDLYKPVTRFGESLGVSFQIRDDVLGLFGKEEETGKPVGADVREDKKTLVRFELLRLLEGDDRAWAASLFGSEVSAAEVSKLRLLAQEAGVLSAVNLHAESADSRAEVALDDLQVPVDARKVLDWLVRFNRSRAA